MEKGIAEKLFNLLEKNPNYYDVAFIVGRGSAQKIVKSLKLILKAASSVFEFEFQDRWKGSGVNEGEEIQLLDYDPLDFQLFIKLTMLDKWSFESLKNLNLRPNQVLSLTSMCTRFGIKYGLKNLEEFERNVLKSFTQFKDTDEFLGLSRANLERVLSSDDLEKMSEIDLFNCAIRWAANQCLQDGKEPTGDHLGHYLGPCLFKIRFPTMTNQEFTKVSRIKYFLTMEETLQIYQYIGMEESERSTFDAASLPDNTVRRKVELRSEPESSMPTPEPEPEPGQVLTSGGQSKSLALLPLPLQSSVAGQSSRPAAYSTLRFTKGERVVNVKPTFFRDGQWFHYNCMQASRKIAILGLGFHGPTDADTTYNITVKISRWPKTFWSGSGKINRRIFARKNHLFHLFFDRPIIIEAIVGHGAWDDYYTISWGLQGTSAFRNAQKEAEANLGSIFRLEQEGTEFHFCCCSNQLAEIKFEKL